MAATDMQVVKDIDEYRPFHYGKQSYFPFQSGVEAPNPGKPSLIGYGCEDKCAFCNKRTYQYVVFSYELQIAWHCFNCGAHIINESHFETYQGRRGYSRKTGRITDNGKMRRSPTTARHVDMVMYAMTEWAYHHIEGHWKNAIVYVGAPHEARLPENLSFIIAELQTNMTPEQKATQRRYDPYGVDDKNAPKTQEVEA